MAIPFSRSMRSLEQDRFLGASWILGVAALLFAAWLVWFFGARIRLYEVTRDARLEVAGSSTAVAVEVSGRVATNHMELDRFVEAGDVLLELEAGAEELTVAEGVSRARGIAAQAAQLGKEIESEKAALASAQAAARLEIEEAQADFSAAESRWQLLGQQHESQEELHRQGIRSQLDLAKAKSEVTVAEAEMTRQRVRIDRLREEWQVEARDRGSTIDGLERNLSELQSQLAESQSSQERLGLEVERHVVRAPVAGRLGEVLPLREGAFVSQGDKLCSIVPEGGELLVAAHYLPAQALGRVRPGQDAELRLDGYPWAQYGTVSASVQRVGSEVSSGTVRVELAIVADEASPIPLDHGLPGVLEIEVERVSPAVLVLRRVGKMLSRPTGADSAAP